MASGPRKNTLSDLLRRYAGASRPGWFSPTALVLIAANLLPLYGVLVLGWAVLPIVVLFWLENIVVGVLNILRIVLASPADAARWAGKLLLVPFFIVHYGLFTAIHGLFVFSLFGGEPYQALVHGLWTVDAARHVIAEFALWPGIGALAASHLLSFLWNYLGQGEYRQARPEALMQAPYSRVVALHVAILLGAILIQLFHSPLWALLLLIGLKIGIDLRAHLKEHRRQQPAESPAASP
jgi:hypothetical protein